MPHYFPSYKRIICWWLRDSKEPRSTPSAILMLARSIIRSAKFWLSDLSTPKYNRNSFHILAKAHLELNKTTRKAKLVQIKKTTAIILGREGSPVDSVGYKACLRNGFLILYQKFRVSFESISKAERQPLWLIIFL